MMIPLNIMSVEQPEQQLKIIFAVRTRNVFMLTENTAGDIIKIDDLNEPTFKTAVDRRIDQL